MAATAMPRIPARPAPLPTGRTGGRLLFWLRLATLALVGGGFAFPLVLAAISNATTGEAAGVGRSFLAGLQELEDDAFVLLLTPTARENAEIAVPSASGAERMKAIRGSRIVRAINPQLRGHTLTFELPVRRGDIIHVPYHLTPTGAAPVAPGEEQPNSKIRQSSASSPRLPVGTVLLREVDGHWRVSGMTFRQQVFDFEANNFNGPVTRTDTPDPTFALLSPITSAEFAAAWETDVRIDKRPAREVLKKLAGELGRPIAGEITLWPDLASILQSRIVAKDDALDRPVTLNLRKASRFEAVEEVCRQVGIYPTYQGNVIGFRSGKRPHPVAIRGPFLLEGGTLSEDVPNAAGKLQFQLHTALMPPRIAAFFANMPVYVSDLQVKGPAGEDLYHSGKQILLPPGNAFWGKSSPGSFYLKLGSRVLSHPLTVPLKNLLRDIDGVAEVRFTIRAVLPRQVHPLRLEPVAPGREVGAEDFRLTLRQIDANPVTQAGLGGTVAGQRRYDFRLVPVAGRRLCWQTAQAGQAPASGWAIPTPSGDFAVYAPGSIPSKIVFAVLSGGEELAWDFRLGPFSLRRPPRKIATLPPGGANPVRVAEARITPSGLELRLHAQGSKEIDSFDLKTVYLDANERVLGQSIRKASADTTDSPTLILPNPQNGKTGYQWHVIDKAERPKGTHSVAVSVTRVLFKDATTWRP